MPWPRKRFLTKERKKMKGLLILAFFFVALALKEATATQHGVAWDPSTDFSSWASGRTFKVGDKLLFKYTAGLHSVVEVSSEKEYKNCDIGNAVDSMNGGNDVVKLTKPGTRYFACGTLGHCGQGMKLKVKVVAANEAATSESSTTTTTSAALSSSAAASFVLVVVVSLIIGLVYIV